MSILSSNTHGCYLDDKKLLMIFSYFQKLLSWIWEALKPTHKGHERVISEKKWTPFRDLLKEGCVAENPREQINRSVEIATALHEPELTTERDRMFYIEPQNCRLSHPLLFAEKSGTPCSGLELNWSLIFDVGPRSELFSMPAVNIIPFSSMCMECAYAPFLRKDA